ncbi:MAG: FMN-binding protein [Erysipelothrix sp.]|nr:FMN-binding protein [Erysipelothrix sp.]
MKENILITILFILLLVGCSSEPAVQSKTVEEVLINDGIYQGQAPGRNGVVIVEVKIESQVITDVRIVNHQEDTRYVAEVEVAIVEIPERIVKSNSTQVDVVSKATVTSKAIMKAVEDAITNAK